MATLEIRDLHVTVDTESGVKDLERGHISVSWCCREFSSWGW